MDDQSSHVVLSNSYLSNRSELNLFQKIIKIMEKVSFIEKGASVSTGANSASYKAIQHDDVTALLHPHCADWGIVVLPSITSAMITEIRKESTYNGKTEIKLSYRSDVYVDVEFINADKPDERIISKTFSYAMDSGDKATGKAYSMAVKYAYLKTFMLQSGDDEESRDFENRSNYNPNNDRNSGQNNRQNNNRNQSANNGVTNTSTANNKGNQNANINNGNGASSTSQSNQSQGQQKNDQKGSQANDNQIKAIKTICEKKSIEVGEKFKAKENCTSQEASQEISRLNSIKV